MWPSPRPDIFPKGTPHAATIGPTASDVLSPTPPVECLSTNPSGRGQRRRSIVSPLAIIASVSANVSAPDRPLEAHSHEERGHLVVGHVASRVAEHQLGDLVAAELLAVALALDELGRPDHLSATKITGRRETTSGPSSAGISPTSPKMPRDGWM